MGQRNIHSKRPFFVVGLAFDGLFPVLHAPLLITCTVRVGDQFCLKTQPCYSFAASGVNGWYCFWARLLIAAIAVTCNFNTMRWQLHQAVPLLSVAWHHLFILLSTTRQHNA